MNIKIELTKYVANQLGLPVTDKDIRNYKRKWWSSTRIKETGGLRLTEDGFNALINADIKFHKITIETDLTYTSQTLIRLDNYIDSPWFLTNRCIYVFTEKMAIQLVLFSGDIQKFLISKAERAKLD